MDLVSGFQTKYFDSPNHQINSTGNNALKMRLFGKKKE